MVECVEKSVMKLTFDVDIVIESIGGLENSMSPELSLWL